MEMVPRILVGLIYLKPCLFGVKGIHKIVGNVYTDVVSIGNVTIPNQAVELAETLSSAFQQDGGSDGLLGLAWPILNTVTPQQQATPVENMINQNIISSVNSQRHPFTTINHTY